MRKIQVNGSCVQRVVEQVQSAGTLAMVFPGQGPQWWAMERSLQDGHRLS